MKIKWLLLFCLSNTIYAQPGTIEWKIEIGMQKTKSPAISIDGTIYTTTQYFSSQYGNWVGTLYSIDPRGFLKWKATDTEKNAFFSCSTAKDGSVYVGWRKYLLNYNKDGQSQWRADLLGGYPDFASSPAIGNDGTIYATIHNDLYAISPIGEILWDYDANNTVFSSPAIDSEGTIYFCARNSTLHAVNPSGSRKWTFRPQEYNELTNSPIIDGDGNILFVTDNEPILFSVNQNGKMNWKVHLNSNGKNQQIDAIAPVIGEDGTIYCYDGEHSLRALNKDGSAKWSYKTESIQSTPAIGSDRRIYFGDLGGWFYALNPDGSLEWSTFVERDIRKVTISDNGMLIFYCHQDICAVSTAASGLASSAWPCWGRNTSNSRNASDIPVNSFTKNKESDKINSKQFILFNNYPNPFNPSTIIRYQLIKPGHVDLFILNSHGQYIKHLVDKDQLQGEYTISWDGRDDSGNIVPSGIYLYRVTIDQQSEYRKMVFIH